MVLHLKMYRFLEYALQLKVYNVLFYCYLRSKSYMENEGATKWVPIFPPNDQCCLICIQLIKLSLNTAVGFQVCQSQNNPLSATWKTSLQLM